MPVKKTINQIIFVVFLFAVWQVLAALKIWPSYVFPTPGGVVEALGAGFKDHSILIAIEASMIRVVVAYAISVVFGILLGMALTWSKFLEDTVGHLVLSLQSLPSLCWQPLAVLWFGLTENAIIFVAVMGSLLAVTQNTKAGFDNVPRILTMAGRNLGAKGPQMFRYVLLPASLPFLLDGLRQGWAFAWRSLVSGEMLFVTIGLGQLLTVGRDLNDINQVVAVMFLITVIGYVVDGIVFGKIETSVRNKWGMSTAASR
jgi:NitT/TauT family transport system permease protein